VAEARKETVQLALKRLRQSAPAVAEAAAKGVRSALRKRQLKRLRERLKTMRRQQPSRKRKKRRHPPVPVAEAVQNSSAVRTVEVFPGMKYSPVDT